MSMWFIISFSFLVNMHCAFQDQEYLYLVIDYLSGGDLRYYQTYHLKFQEDQLSIF